MTSSIEISFILMSTFGRGIDLRDRKIIKISFGYI